MTLSNNGNELVVCPPEPVPRMARSHPERNGGSAKGEGSVPVDWEALARAYLHPLRISILEVLGIDGGRVLSPSDLSKELRVSLNQTDYHVRQLAKAGLLVHVFRRPVRGTNENFYRLS